VTTRRYSIRHRTTYEYEGDVVHAHQLLHLVPRACDRQTVFRHSVEVAPAPSIRSDGLDAFGNPLTRLEFDRPHKRLEVSAELEVEVRPHAATFGEAGQAWESTRAALAYGTGPVEPERLDAWRFRLQSPYVRLKTVFADYAEDCFPAGSTTLAGARGLMTKIHASSRTRPARPPSGRRSPSCSRSGRASARTSRM